MSIFTTFDNNPLYSEKFLELLSKLYEPQTMPVYDKLCMLAARNMKLNDTQTYSFVYHNYRISFKERYRTNRLNTLHPDLFEEFNAIKSDIDYIIKLIHSTNHAYRILCLFDSTSFIMQNMHSAFTQAFMELELAMSNLPLADSDSMLKTNAALFDEINYAVSINEMMR